MPAYIEQVKAAVNKLVRNFPSPGLHTAGNVASPVLMQELWTAALDTTNVWTTTLGGTGSASANVSAGHRLMNLSCGAGLDAAAISSKRLFGVPDQLPTAAATIHRKLIVEWMAALVSVANTDNAVFNMGLAPSDGGVRTTGDLIGFVLVSDALNTLTDVNGTETLTVVSSPPTLTDWNKYRIEIERSTGDQLFYVNEVLKNRHTTTYERAISGRINFNTASEIAVASQLLIGPVRCWVEE